MVWLLIIWRMLLNNSRICLTSKFAKCKEWAVCIIKNRKLNEYRSRIIKIIFKNVWKHGFSLIRINEINGKEFQNAWSKLTNSSDYIIKSVLKLSLKPLILVNI